jgi:ABC-type phosphate transport system auxiliary subunit
MLKFLAGCHYNEEEISRHLKRNIGYWPVQMNGNKFATGQILKKTSRSCEGVDFSWLSSEVSRTLKPAEANLILLYIFVIANCRPIYTHIYTC